ncbi:hypothetical protein F4859DRAFT_376992 [Xylaria cf. heliscus]|nr:hypothetical protein F4859DRAFT_376992 [Xylaria cf. heliscus]
MDAAGLSISLAEIVLKFVIFSLDFVGDAKQVYKHGATDRNVDLSTIVQSVEGATTGLMKQLDSFDNNRRLDTGDEQLKELSLRAAEIGQELTQRLRRVTSDDRSRWRSLKAAAIGMWDASDIEKTEKRLDAIKNQIQFRILVDIRAKVDLSHDDGNARILLALEEVAKQHAGSKEDTKRMIEKLNDADEIGRSRHEELVQLGTQLLNGINAISTSTSPHATHLPQDAGAVLNEATRLQAERSILNSLWYPSMHSREESISETFTDTFKWVFEDPKTTGKPWDNLVDFLKGDASRAYWITGKPGCGKSTLMKFVCDSPITQGLLEQWAGKRYLIKAFYYFYYYGDDNQKSELGLIRSLLYSILDKRRDLIPSTFKTRFQDVIEGREHDDLSLPEARKALRDLMDYNSNLCFFVSIDGLDEFDPLVSRTRVQSLIELTHSLGKHKNVKLLVSSRPLPEFELGYDGMPSLTVHHLTQRDIRHYANEKLMNHPRMKILVERNPESMRQLLQLIVDSSLGVFLWVRLVTESLMEGLTNHDDIDYLKKRVDELPSDLKDLYRTMLSRTDHRYRPQIARLLCFVHHIQNRGEMLSLIDFWFAENADDNMVHTTPVNPMTDEEGRVRVQELESLFRSRCMGLIETVTIPKYPDAFGTAHLFAYDSSTEEAKVTTARFLHKSVYEFLDSQDIWGEFVRKYLSPTFSVTVSLFRSAILIIKTCRLSPECHDTWETVMYLASRTGIRASLAEEDTEQPHDDLVHELDLAMHGVMPLVYCSTQSQGELWPEKGYIPTPECHWWAWCRTLRLLRNKQETWWPLWDNTHSSLMAFAAEHGLKHYIGSQIACTGRKVLDKPGFPLLGYALMPSTWYNHETIKYLLDKGCNPNEVYKGMTVWEWFLWTIGCFGEDRMSYTALGIMEMLLFAGANPNGKLLWVLPTEAPNRDVGLWGLSVSNSWDHILLVLKNFTAHDCLFVPGQCPEASGTDTNHARNGNN